MEELEKALRATFEDYRLSKTEKVAFRDLLEDYKHEADTLSFVRNKAFDLVNQHMQTEKIFDVGAYKWLEHIVKSIDTVRTNGLSTIRNEVYFSPGSECKNCIVSLIGNAKESVDVCVFTISDNDISDALYSAHKNNITVRIITDNDKANDLGSDVDNLRDKGLPVIKDISSNHMHHKFAVVDSRYLINGSFNWTRSASKYNNENITVLGDPELIGRFSKKFNEMWLEFGGAV